MDSPEIEVHLLPQRKEGDVLVAGLQMFSPEGNRLSLNPWVIAGPTWQQDLGVDPADIGDELEFEVQSGLVLVHVSLQAWGQCHVNLKLDDDSYLGFVDVDSVAAVMLSFTEEGLVQGPNPDLAAPGAMLVVPEGIHNVKLSSPGGANGHVSRVVLAAMPI